MTNQVRFYRIIVYEAIIKALSYFPKKWFLASLDNDCDVSNLCNYSHNTDSDIAPTTNLELLA